MVPFFYARDKQKHANVKGTRSGIHFEIQCYNYYIIQKQQHQQKLQRRLKQEKQQTQIDTMIQNFPPFDSMKSVSLKSFMFRSLFFRWINS